MEKIKVFFIAPANNIHTIRWVNSLCEKFEIHLVSCKDHIGSQDKLDKKVILHKLSIKSPMGYYLNALQLKKLYKKIKPDLINVHYASGYGTLVRVTKIKPVLISVWGSDVYDFPNESKIKNKIFKKNIYYADYIASTSVAMEKELRRQVKLPQKDIYITPFGVDTNKFKKMEVKKDNNEIRIGNIKTLEPKYGLKYAILAIKELKEELINNCEKELADSIKLYIYGKGYQKEELEKIIKENELENDVFLKGRIPNNEVPEVLNTFDIFCATSILNSESFGVSVVEAMACEIPVIATKVDGFCEVMQDGVTGILVEKENVKAISNAIKNLLKDTAKQIEFGKNARKRVLENYNWQDNVDYMSNIYMKIHKNNKRI